MCGPNQFCLPKTQETFWLKYSNYCQTHIETTKNKSKCKHKCYVNCTHSNSFTSICKHLSISYHIAYCLSPIVCCLLSIAHRLWHAAYVILLLCNHQSSFDTQSLKSMVVMRLTPGLSKNMGTFCQIWGIGNNINTCQQHSNNNNTHIVMFPLMSLLASGGTLLSNVPPYVPVGIWGNTSFFLVIYREHICDTIE